MVVLEIEDETRVETFEVTSYRVPRLWRIVIRKRMVQVIDPAGSSHIFSQFEGGLVYFRFQVAFLTFEIFDFEWGYVGAEEKLEEDMTLNTRFFVCREYQAPGSGAIEWDNKSLEKSLEFIWHFSIKSKFKSFLKSLAFSGETLRGRTPRGRRLHCGCHSRGLTLQSSMQCHENEAKWGWAGVQYISIFHN